MEVKQCSNCIYYKPKLCLLFDELVEGYCRCFMHQKKRYKTGNDKMIDKKYYINVKEIMKPLTRPKCKLSRPKLKPKFNSTNNIN